MIVTIACKYVYVHSGAEIQACVEKRARTHTYMHVVYVKNVCAPVCLCVSLTRHQTAKTEVSENRCLPGECTRVVCGWR